MIIYRSITANRGSDMYPLKRVELGVHEEGVEALIYDVGYEPPYWDVTQLPMFSAFTKTFDQAVEKLKSTHHINVSGWQKVKYSSILVCNAAIRDELRLDLTKEEDFSGLLGRAIPGKVFADSFDILSNDKYSGQPVYARLIMEIQTTEYVGDIRDYPPKTRTVPTLGTFEGFGIFVPANPTASTRNPELTGMSRLIVKNTPDDSSFGIFGSTTSEPKCVLYDQNSGTHLQDGRPIQLLLNFVKLNEMFKISSVGILKGEIEGFEWDAKEDD